MCKKQESWFDRWLFWIYGQTRCVLCHQWIWKKDMYSDTICYVCERTRWTDEEWEAKHKITYP